MQCLTVCAGPVTVSMSESACLHPRTIVKRSIRRLGDSLSDIQLSSAPGSKLYILDVGVGSSCACIQTATP